MSKIQTTDWLKIEDFFPLIKETMSLSTLKKFLYERETNGADYFAKKIGKRVLLSPTRFYEWIEKEGKV